ncbi:MAG TPA: DUF4390 domain-containing protein [Burkholderiaceae bacterium]|nr:DUF4390 domain-containing protein [Burkholderiaceae bacterium]
MFSFCIPPSLVRALRAGTLRLVLAAAASLLFAPVVAAERIEVRTAELQWVDGGDGGVVLDAQFDFDMPALLEDAVNRGIALYFVVEFELYRSRWYWFDRKVASATRHWRLTYSPLTRQYRLASGALALPFESLAEALGVLKRIRGWKVVDRGVISADANYTAQVRMRLDTSQLPKPFQINVLTSRDWTLSSDWRNVMVAADLAK